MSDYVSCRACHGPGLIPLKEAARTEVYDTVNWDAAREAQREREREINRAVLRRRMEAAEDRLARLNAVAWPTRPARERPDQT
jgi:hypothetical protein